MRSRCHSQPMSTSAKEIQTDTRKLSPWKSESNQTQMSIGGVRKSILGERITYKKGKMSEGTKSTGLSKPERGWPHHAPAQPVWADC